MASRSSRNGARNAATSSSPSKPPALPWTRRVPPSRLTPRQGWPLLRLSAVPGPAEQRVPGRLRRLAGDAAPPVARRRGTVAMSDLRERANLAAQQALHASNEYLSRHGRRDAALDATYEAAERV